MTPFRSKRINKKTLAISSMTFNLLTKLSYEKLDALTFYKHCINKNAFHKHKHLTDIDKGDIDKIVISFKDSIVKKVDLNISLGMWLIILNHYA